MISSGVCPNPECRKRLSKVQVEEVELTGVLACYGFNFTCPFCHTVLSVSTDSFATRDQIISGVMKS